MKPIIKKPEFLALKKSVASQPIPEEVILVEPAVADVPIEQQPPQEVAHPTVEYPTYYVPAQSYPVLQSVGNTGWQVSDIWRDLRVDDFCN
ncbi:hypothetical protein [Nostoc sp. FACHB-110]|uniref:hypothetical protein n=1 Tax=Nostoc sp. FACHB-110 TaxID=2692834 RepID=UPI00168849F8|nr:hypothetical protein [Nostoc sp. FACHB-110]MBD2438827.1 hypothetical protein [Nostoc sp. FACHB-110]